MTRINRLACGLIALFMLAGCGETASVDIIQQAVSIESSDECHLCGMLITNFPGPKGELYRRGESQVRKFCSTRDLFAFLLQPENTHRVTRVFVHDMAVTPWQNPEDKVFIDGTTAFYVVNHSRQGAMGPTLASFKNSADADQFRNEFGGEVIRYADISLDLLAAITLVAE